MNSSPWIAFLLFSSFASATPWNPDNYPRNVTHLIAKRVVVDRASRVSRLAKRQTLQPGQPIRKVSDEFIGGFQEVGHSGVSAQQLFLGTDTKVYVIDKVQNNPVSVNGHPAWATEYDLLTDTTRPLDVVTNSFCAGGGVLGDGRWLNVGGNQAVNRGGSDAPEDNQMGNNDYNNYPGGYSTRVLTPGDGSEWEDGTEDDMSSRRWYPTLETVEDGRIIIIGGNQRGGFVNNIENNNPTYEYYPKAEGETPVALNILLETLPANLFPITYLIPTGLLLMNINKNAIMFDYKNNEELPLPPVPFAVRTYPASAATWMLPMKVKDSWLATAYYCGGSDLQPEQWTAGLVLITTPAHQSCIKISPEVSDNFESDDDLPIGRVMASAIVLPDGKVLLVNGANTGVAGYGLEPWTNGDSYADNPVQNPLLFDSTKSPGQRWSGDGLKDSPIPRMYHSSATLLPDGSVFIAGSSPHPDVVTDNTAYPTEYRVEIFYPPYFNKRRPEPRGIPAEIGYGGNYFDLELTNEDLQGNVGNVKTISILLMRTGFSTHGINFGQRAAELDYTYTAKEDGSATLHVAQAPPNPAIMPPGPAWFFVTVNGVPSVGVQVMVGNGQIGAQEMSEPEALPENSEVDETPDDSSNEDGDSSASRVYVANSVAAASIVALALAMFA